MPLRYGWTPSDIPKLCVCQKENTLVHSQTCTCGGFIIMRHNLIRDQFARFLDQAGCKSTEVEKRLLPVEGELAGHPRAIKGDEVRMDVATVGLWKVRHVRVTNPFAPTHFDKPLPKLLEENEKERKNSYLQRIIQVEKGTFTPTTGKECTKVLKELGAKIAEKKKEPISIVMNGIRARISFSLVRSAVLNFRGSQNRKTRRQPEETEPEEEFQLMEAECRLQRME